MKKIISLFLSLATALALCACAAKKGGAENNYVGGQCCVITEAQIAILVAPTPAPPPEIIKDAVTTYFFVPDIDFIVPDINMDELVWENNNFGKNAAETVYAIKNSEWSLSSNAVSYGTIIRSASAIKADMKALCVCTKEAENAFARFDEEFFEKYSLIYLHVNSNVSPQMITLLDIVSGESIDMDITYAKTEGDECAMNTWTVILIVNNGLVKGKEQINVSVSEASNDVICETAEETLGKPIETSTFYESTCKAYNED